MQQIQLNIIPFTPVATKGTFSYKINGGNLRTRIGIAWNFTRKTKSNE